MDELERRLRDSLRNRAGDVEPTPDLWLEVRERRERKRRLRWVAVAGALAAAAVIAVVAVPAALDALRPDGDLVVGPGPTETEQPTSTPTTPPDGTPSENGTSRPAGPPPLNPAYASDGSSLYAFGVRGTAGEPLLTFPEESGTRIVSFDVRPTQDPAVTTIVMLTEAEGMYDLRWATIADGEVEAALFPDAYGLSNPVVGGTVPAPVWSPDGGYVAWAEDGDDGTPGLHIIGWDEDGPGTGRTADDNTSFADLGVDDVDLRLQDWRWTSDTGETGHGAILATAPGGGAYALEVARQPDGAITFDASAPLEADGALLDVAVDQRPGGPAVEYRLTGRGTGEGVIDLVLTRTSPGGDPEELPLPEELDRLLGSDPSDLWMNAAGDGALLGDGGRAWALTLSADDGWTVTRIPEPIVYADLAS